ncbi:MAG TPA: helix-turn-helix transcriptional regulator [Flavobacterium sp.]|uniref:helix-turn-helix domain-containing protein n=1 Tax=Flavobacterium sp. TaxID=239 RepID=UPI002B864A22|nr:helix-turn-helix transcriptional regulator [Flavobacterium sp.]HNP31803.1 helix-turn-helix transcriptional regulator [Flavobacterium sp.]
MDKQSQKEFLVKFGVNLRKVRLEKGFTQEQLANELGVEVSQISRIERGIISTSVIMLYSISNVLEVNVSRFFDLE